MESEQLDVIARRAIGEACSELTRNGLKDPDDWEYVFATISNWFLEALLKLHRQKVLCG